MLETKKGRIKKKICSEKNEMGKLQTLLKKFKCSVLSKDIFSQCQIYLINSFITRKLTSFCYVLEPCPFEDKAGCSEVLQAAFPDRKDALELQ